MKKYFLIIAGLLLLMPLTSNAFSGQGGCGGNGIDCHKLEKKDAEAVLKKLKDAKNLPTDLQAQFMALATTAEGTSTFSETIFENLMQHAPELVRLGAKIGLEGNHAIVRGPVGLEGAPVMATDLRASVSLVLAGLTAEGDTYLNLVYHLDRGYEELTDKLSACGAEIERLSDGAAE